MTTVLSIGRRDDLGGSSLASHSLHMQRTPHALEPVRSTTSARASSSVVSGDNSNININTQNPNPTILAAGAGDTASSLHEVRAEREQTQQQMTTMRDRYRIHEDDAGARELRSLDKEHERQAATSSSSSSSAAAAAGLSGSSAHKRRHSQRSPSRPRSQQGSQAAQIASVKELERENASAGRFVRRDEQFVREDSNSPRKTPRLSDAVHGSSGDWPQKRRLSHVSESEPTSASSTRIRVSHSRNSSADETTTAKEEHESHYTWQHRERGLRERARDGHAEYGGGGGAPSTYESRLPPLAATGFHPTSSSAPPSAAQRHQQLEPDDALHSTSPPPRLPGFATLSPYQQQHGGQRPSPPLMASPSRQQTSHYQHAAHSGGAGHQRMNSSGMPAYGATSPRPGHGPSSMSATSPSLSQASHTTPGQAFIHPSLAGLPGAGGGAGSKQQPSFVSKLYSMLEDDTIEDMIAWGPAGTTFSVANPAEFAKIVLPNWFKHSNWQSFVRQLNMYGFHKVNHTYQGTPEEEIQVWEFKHPSFRRGEVHLLSEIKRKSSRHKRQDSLTRSMTHAAEYDMGGTPSPEMDMPPNMGGNVSRIGVQHHHGGYASVAHAPHHPPSGPSPPGYGPPVTVARPGYVDYAAERGAAAQVSASQQHSLLKAAAPPSQQSEHDVRQVAPPPLSRDVVMAADGNVALRIEDLSDRIDAIIRHASYLEEQLRSVSEQLFHAQQNEASLRTHVHHLESQMRSLSDQLYQARHGSASGSAPLSHPPAPHSPSLSTTSSFSRARPLQGGTSPPPLSSRYGGPAAPPPPSVSSASYPARSPIIAHPSYANRSAVPSAAAVHPSNRVTPASSADAYTRLGPPPPPASITSRGGKEE